MPLGILYVSAALKASGVANVFTINLNHQDETDDVVLSRIIKENKIHRVVSFNEINKEYYSKCNNNRGGRYDYSRCHSCYGGF